MKILCQVVSLRKKSRFGLTALTGNVSTDDEAHRENSKEVNFNFQSLPYFNLCSIVRLFLERGHLDLG